MFQALYVLKTKNIKFVKLNAEDFKISSLVVDSRTNAIILSDMGISKIDGNSKGFFSLIYIQTRRIKVLNRKGFDAADVSIILYSSGSDEEKLTNCKAITYNLNNGSITETKLESSNIFKKK